MRSVESHFVRNFIRKYTLFAICSEMSAVRVYVRQYVCVWGCVIGRKWLKLIKAAKLNNKFTVHLQY